MPFKKIERKKIEKKGRKIEFKKNPAIIIIRRKHEEERSKTREIEKMDVTEWWEWLRVSSSLTQLLGDEGGDGNALSVAFALILNVRQAAEGGICTGKEMLVKIGNDLGNSCWLSQNISAELLKGKENHSAQVKSM